MNYFPISLAFVIPLVLVQLFIVDASDLTNETYATERGRVSTSGMVTQEYLQGLQNKTELDATKVFKVQAHKWDPVICDEMYATRICNEYVYNEHFNHTNFLVNNTFAKQQAEIALNELAEFVYQRTLQVSQYSTAIRSHYIRSNFLSPLDIQNGWSELKQALLNQNINNMSIVVFNNFRKSWTYCAWVDNWYLISNSTLRNVLERAPDHLRVCCDYSLLGLPVIRRSPVYLLDYIPMDIIYQLSENRYGSNSTSVRSNLSQFKQHNNSNITNSTFGTLLVRPDDSDTVEIDLFASDSDFENCYDKGYLNSNCYSACCASSYSATSMCTEDAMNCGTLYGYP